MHTHATSGSLAQNAQSLGFASENLVESQDEDADFAPPLRVSTQPSRSVLEAGEALGHHICSQNHGDLVCNAIGPLPRSGALVVHYKSWAADSTVIRGHHHPHHYRIAVMLEPMEAQVWTDGHAAWTGVLAAGRFRIVAPGTDNQWRHNSGCDNVNIFIPKSFASTAASNEVVSQPANVFKATSFIQDREVFDLARKLIGSRSLVHQYSEQYCEGLMDALTGYLLANYTETPRGTRRTALDRAVLQRLLEWLAGMHATPPTVSEMARRCGFSESHFSREFALAVGVPPHKYVLNMRLNQAAELLFASNAPIIEVALDLGFSSASHFSRAFAQKFGVPPASYRRRQMAMESKATAPLTAGQPKA